MAVTASPLELAKRTSVGLPATARSLRMPADPSDLLSVTRGLVQAAQSGDDAALEDLFARYLPRVRRIVAGRMQATLRELADVEDVVQDTLLDAFRGLRGFDYASTGAFCNWLARSVQNKLSDRGRRTMAAKRGGGRVRRFADQADLSFAESIFPDNGPTPSEVAVGDEENARVERAMLLLGDRYREVINLRVWCGMSHAEVAETMGLTNENTANALFLRARSKLRRLL